MKRDMDIIRAILLTVKNCDEQTVQIIKLDEYPQKAVNSHIYLLVQAGFIIATDMRSPSPSSSEPDWLQIELTWDGHDFIDDAQDEETWSKLKVLVAEKGGSASVAVITSLLVALTKKSFGLP